MQSNPTEDKKKGICFPMTCRGWQQHSCGSHQALVCVSRSVVSDSLQFHGLRELNPPGSSAHGILQARILEWVAIPFSRGSSLPWDQTWVSHVAGRLFTNWAARKASGSCVLSTRLYLRQSRCPSHLQSMGSLNATAFSQCNDIPDAEPLQRGKLNR